MTRLHYSPSLDAYAECRARSNCPFGGSGEHHTTHEAVQLARKKLTDEVAAGVPMSEVSKPVLKDSHGGTKQIAFQKDGGYKIGSRTYDRDGQLVAAPSTQRVRQHREVKAWATLATGSIDPDLKKDLDALVDSEDQEPIAAELEADDEARQRLQLGRDMEKEHEFYRAVFQQTMADEEADALADQLIEALNRRGKNGTKMRDTLPEPFLWKAYAKKRSGGGLFGWFLNVCRRVPWASEFLRSYRASYTAVKKDKAKKASKKTAA